MKITIQISGNWDKKQVEFLSHYGLMIGEGINTILIEEEKLNKDLFPILKEWDVLIGKGVEFDKKEILASKYNVLCRFNSCGYPMPDSDFGYKDLTYSNIKTYCKTCDIGKIQKDDFRINIFPKKSKLWALEWVYDEFFVDKTTYEEVFHPFGIDCRSVRQYKKDTIIDSIVQLIIPETDQPLDLSDYEYTVCPVCGERKYESIIKGFFPLQENPTLPMYKSKESFGSGASACKKVFISAQLRDKMLENKLVKLNYFAPCVNR